MNDHIIKLLLEYCDEEYIDKLLIENKLSKIIPEKSNFLLNTFKYLVDKDFLNKTNCNSNDIASPDLFKYFNDKYSIQEELYKMSNDLLIKVSNQFFQKVDNFAPYKQKEIFNFFINDVEKFNDEQKEIIFSIASQNIKDKKSMDGLLNFYKNLNIPTTKTNYFINPGFSNIEKPKVGTYFKKEMKYNSYSEYHKSYFYIELLKNHEYIETKRRDRWNTAPSKFEVDMGKGLYKFLSSVNDINPREKQKEHIFDILYIKEEPRIYFNVADYLVTAYSNLAKTNSNQMNFLKDNYFFDDLFENLKKYERSYKKGASFLGNNIDNYFNKIAMLIKRDLFVDVEKTYFNVLEIVNRTIEKEMEIHKHKTIKDFYNKSILETMSMILDSFKETKKLKDVDFDSVSMKLFKESNAEEYKIIEASYFEEILKPKMENVKNII